MGVVPRKRSEQGGHLSTYACPIRGVLEPHPQKRFWKMIGPRKNVFQIRPHSFSNWRAHKFKKVDAREKETRRDRNNKTK